MDKIQHNAMVLKLAKSGFTIRDELTASDCHELHMIVGVVGEVGELLDCFDKEPPLDYDNAVEELGDIEFYLEGLRQSFGWTQESVLKDFDPLDYKDILPHGSLVTPTTHKLVKLAIVTCDLLDLVKKVVIYRTDYDLSAIGLRMIKVDVLLKSIREDLGVSREKVIQANIDKLAERYRGFEYSDQQAQDRADKQGDE